MPVSGRPSGTAGGLRAGKIYPAERIDAALENFFREENLASLRELAMRQIADRLDGPPSGRAEPDRGASAEPAASLMRAGAEAAPLMMTAV